MLHFEFRQDRLAQPHPLRAFELAQRPVERPLEARFVAEQAIQLGNIGQASGPKSLRLLCEGPSDAPDFLLKGRIHGSGFLMLCDTASYRFKCYNLLTTKTLEESLRRFKYHFTQPSDGA